jgi:putative cardiolipin synthase
VLLVHSGYAKYRRELLEAGVNLYELKLRGGVTPESAIQLKPLGLSGASLHAKTFAMDGERIFIGSFNFDPRSAMLNCEMGFLIDSPSMAQQVSAGFDGPLDLVSYQPELTPENKMIWVEEKRQGDPVIYQEEPGATWFQQIATVVIGWLPVEWLL